MRGSLRRADDVCLVCRSTRSRRGLTPGGGTALRGQSGQRGTLAQVFVQDGRTQTKPMGGNRRSHAMYAQASLIRQIYETQPELFLHELRDRLTGRAPRVGGQPVPLLPAPRHHT